MPDSWCRRCGRSTGALFPRSGHTQDRGIFLSQRALVLGDGFNHTDISVSVVIHRANPTSRIVASGIAFTPERKLSFL